MSQKKTLEKILEERKPSKTDPMGSWTGLPVDEQTVPVQDADDL